METRENRSHMVSSDSFSICCWILLYGREKTWKKQSQMPVAKMTLNTNWHVLPAALLMRKKNNYVLRPTCQHQKLIWF